MTTKTSAARSARFQTKIEVQLQCSSFKTCQVCRNLPQVTPFYILDFTPTMWQWARRLIYAWWSQTSRWQMLLPNTHPTSGRNWMKCLCCLGRSTVRSEDHKKQMQPAEGWTITGIVQDPIHLGCWYIDDASRWESLGSNRKCSCGYPKA